MGYRRRRGGRKVIGGRRNRPDPVQEEIRRRMERAERFEKRKRETAEAEDDERDADEF